MEKVAAGRVCGSPLSEPCFEHGRCRPTPEGPGLTLYVYDDDCTLNNSSDMLVSKEVDGDQGLGPIWRDAAKDLGE